MRGYLQKVHFANGGNHLFVLTRGALHVAGHLPLVVVKNEKKDSEKQKRAVAEAEPLPFHFCEPFCRVVLPQFATNCRNHACSNFYRSGIATKRLAAKSITLNSTFFASNARCNFYRFQCSFVAFAR